MRLWPRSDKQKCNPTKERIKEATLELIIEKGYASVSMRDIAKRADTAVGQLTYYYKTKEKLILEVVNELVENILKRLKSKMEISTNKLGLVDDFLNGSFEEEADVCKIMINIMTESLYNKKLRKITITVLSDLEDILTEAYIETEESLTKQQAIQKSKELINYYIGRVARKSIESEEMKTKEETTMYKEAVQG